MSHGLFVIGIVKNAYSLKDTQWIGKQSPQLTMSIGSQSTQRAQTTIYRNGGTSVVWNQTLHIQVLHTHTVPHVLFEVQSGSKLIGSCRVPMSDIGEPKDFPLQLKDMKGKYAGTVNVTLQLYNGDINAALHAMKQKQAALAQRKQQSSAIGGFAQPGQSGGACGGGFSQPTHAVGGFVQPGSSGGGFSQPVQQHSVAGGFQQPSTAPPQRPIGGFTVSGSQNVGGVSRSTDQAGFSVPTTVPANSQGFQGYHQQENITQRTDYIPQAGASVDGRSAYPLHAPPPVYTPRAVYNAPQFPQPSAPVAGAGKYEEEEMPTAILVSSSSMQELPSPPQQHQSSLPLGWEERYDPATSRSYFVNCKTQVSQWERPM